MFRFLARLVALCLSVFLQHCELITFVLGAGVVCVLRREHSATVPARGLLINVLGVSVTHQSAHLFSSVQVALQNLCS